MRFIFFNISKKQLLWKLTKKKNNNRRKLFVMNRVSMDETRLF